MAPLTQNVASVQLVIWPWLAIIGLVALTLMPMWSVTLREGAWARDRWIVGTLAVGVCWLATVEICLALIALAALAQWQGPAQLPALVIWGTILLTWFLVAGIPTSGGWWLGWGFALAAMCHTVACGMQRAWLLANRRYLGSYYVLGLLGHRTFAAGALVLLLPFTWPWLTIPTLGGLLLTESWLGWVAAAAALGMLAPWTLLVLIPLCAGIVWVPWVWHRHTLADSVRARWGTYKVLWRARSWRGHGPGFAPWLMNRSDAPHAGAPHCEPFVYAIEYGFLGVLAMLALVIRVAPHLKLGDPWSAAVVGGAVLMIGTTPARVPQLGAVWWAQVAWVATR